MKVAVPVWQGNVSSVFDFAHRLLLVELVNGAERNRDEVVLTEQSGPERIAKLRQLGVNVLICGAISRPLADMLGGSGVQVLAFVTGPIEQVLTAYKTGQLSRPQYTLPGCWKGARKGFHGRRGRHGRRW
jgi:predicted Fe-Mo cluster-binding NifX family protein